MPDCGACHCTCDVSATLQDSGLPWADNNLSGLTLRREECSVVWRILIKADYAKSWGQGLTLNLVTGCDNIYRGMSVTWECHVSRVTRVTGSSHTLGCVTHDVSCDHHYKHIGRGDQTLVDPWISVMSLQLLTFVTINVSHLLSIMSWTWSLMYYLNEYRPLYKTKNITHNYIL